MTDTNLPQDKFAWLGKAPAPDGIVAPEDNPTPVLRAILPPNRVVSLGDGLGLLRWVMSDENERQDMSSGCQLMDTFVHLAIPKEDS